jgi:hypothetical protein
MARPFHALLAVELGERGRSFGAVDRTGGVALKPLTSHGGPRRGNQPTDAFLFLSILSITDQHSPFLLAMLPPHASHDLLHCTTTADRRRPPWLGITEPDSENSPDPIIRRLFEGLRSPLGPKSRNPSSGRHRGCPRGCPTTAVTFCDSGLLLHRMGLPAT